MIYERAPDPARSALPLVVFPTPVECRAFRHAMVFGSPFGEPAARYYAEFEWEDMETFKRVASSPEFAAAGADAMAMGIPFTVQFAELS